MLTLSPAQRRELRARAHPLHPVVAIGHAGLTPSVLHEIDVALTAHELIKVRVHSDDRDERERFLADVCEGLDAAPVQHLGKLLIVWRPKPAPERDERERPRRPPARRRDERTEPKDSSRRRGPPEPQIGKHARKHRRGASRHDPGAPSSGAQSHPARRRTTRSAIVEPAVPTTSAPRGARYSHGKPVAPKVRRPGQASQGKHGAFGADKPAQRRRDARGSAPDAASTRPPQAPRRRPTTQRRQPTATSAAPQGVRRRRRTGSGH